MSRMKIRKKIGLAVVLTVSVYWLCTAIMSLVSDHMVIDYNSPADDAADWMASIEDERLLSLISIPGTHDSATKNTPFHYSFQCQETGIEDQLLMGYRFLDIRLELASYKNGEGEMYLMHGIGHCKNDDGSYMTFDDFESQCIDFLKDHPSETIIVLVDTATDRTSKADGILSGLIKEVSDNPSSWYTDNRIPKLGEVRGKIILATRFGGEDAEGEDFGLDLEWDSQNSLFAPSESQVGYAINGGLDTFLVQNWYRVTANTKWEVVKETLNLKVKEEHTLLINYLPISRGLLFLPCPKLMAINLNGKFSSFALTGGNCYGIVIFDFGTADLAKKVYETNR